MAAVWAVLAVSFLTVANGFLPELWNCDLLEMSHDLSNESTVYPLKHYTENKFKLETIVKGMLGPSIQGGGQFYVHYNRFSAIEHISTHMDAPKHVLRDLAAARKAKTVDQVTLKSLVGEACVIDIPDQHKHDIDYRITIDDVINWEGEHGKFHENCFVIIRSGQGKYWGDTKKYLGSDDPGHLDPITGWPDNTHFPGMHWEAAKWILDNRGMKGVGQDAMSFDYGALRDFTDSIHTVVLGANKPGFENLANVDKLPHRGATIVALPMLIKHGSGAPVRVMAVGWNGASDPCRLNDAPRLGNSIVILLITALFTKLFN